MRPLLLCTFCSVVFSAQQNPVQDVDVAMLQKAPFIDGDSYRCDEMTKVINHFRQLGKDKSLAAMRRYLANGGDNDKVLIVCRLLFVNPKGWEQPNIGHPEPEIRNTAKEFPVFPIAISDRVPFLLVRGYLISGRGELAAN